MIITFNKFKRIEALLNVGEDDITKITNEEELAIRMLEIVTGKRKREIRELPFKKLESLLLELTVKLKMDKELLFRYVEDGIEYGLVPNFMKISTGELIDLDTLMVEEKYNEIVNILYRPIIKEDKFGYEIGEYKGSINHITKMPFNNVLALIDFFSESLKYLNNIHQ